MPDRQSFFSKFRNHVYFAEYLAPCCPIRLLRTVVTRQQICPEFASHRHLRAGHSHSHRARFFKKKKNVSPRCETWCAPRTYCTCTAVAPRMCIEPKLSTFFVSYTHANHMFHKIRVCSCSARIILHDPRVRPVSALSDGILVCPWVRRAKNCQLTWLWNVYSGDDPRNCVRALNYYSAGPHTHALVCVILSRALL